MSKAPCPISGQTDLEERINSAMHGIGVLLSVAAFCVLVVSAYMTHNMWHIVSSAVFGVSLIALYLASTLYHSAKSQARKRRLKVFDHACIYLLIAGTYTPFTLGPLRGTWGWLLFGVIWSCAAIGIIFKLFFTGRFKLASTFAYLAMGWLGVFLVVPLAQVVPAAAIYWIVAGGLCYTIGAVFYMNKRIPFQHAIFHLFVLFGSACHFISIFFYVVV